MSETLILTKRWGKPNSAALETYRADGGYAALDKALSMDPGAIVDEVKKSNLRGRGGAGFARAQVDLPPQGRPPALPHDQRRRVRARGPSRTGTSSRNDPHLLIEGIAITCSPSASTGPTSTSAASSPSRRASCRTRSARPARRPHRRAARRQEGLRPRGQRPPRRRRLRLRRGVCAPGVARGQARQPAAQAPVPGDRRPLEQADDHQQRRDDRQHPLDHRQRERGLRRPRHGEDRRHAALRRLRPREPARRLREAGGIQPQEAAHGGLRRDRRRPASSRP